MRVLHLVTTLNPGGIERWILQMLEAIPRADCGMDVCCQGFECGRWAYQARALGAEVMLNPFTPDHVVFGIGLARILRQGNYNILHIHNAVYGGFPTWIGHRMNVKVIITSHSAKFFPQTWLTKLPVVRSLRSVYRRWSMKYAVEKSDLLVGVSQASLEALVSPVEKFRPKSFVIPHGVNILAHKAGQSREWFLSNLGWSDNSRLIIHVGRFDAAKNQHGVIKVFKKVSENVSEARLIFVGDGDMRSTIEKLAHDLSLSDKVAFLGFRDDVPEIMGFCDLMLMPSLYEGFGIAAIEAAAAGLPVVASRVPGLVEAIEDGRTGLLFEPKDSSGMADAIGHLLSDSDFATKMGEAGRQRVREHFSIESMAASYVALYRRCM